MSTETTASSDTISVETTTRTRRPARVLPAVAGLLLLVAVWPQLKREAQQRVQAQEGQPRAEAVSFGEVRGVVTLDGQPLGTVEVAFLPDPELGTRGATATCYTDGLGRFTLRTEKENHDGARIGHHRVVVNDIAALSGRGGAKKNRLPPEYSDPLRTPLRAEVRAGPQAINLDLVTPEPEEPNP